jgi:hypothetical protein
VRELQQHLPDAAGRRASLPAAPAARASGSTSAAASSRAPCAARRAIRIRSTATNCSKNIVELEDKQLPCKTDNCTGTWTWTKARSLPPACGPELKESDEPEVTSTVDLVAAAAAVAAGILPEAAVTPSSKKRKKRKRVIKPPERRCENCSDFLKDKKTLEIPCKSCGTPIFWPPESQLQTHLGAWAEPSMCGACKRDAMEAARNAEREALRNAHPGPGETPTPPVETSVEPSATEPPQTPAD